MGGPMTEQRLSKYISLKLEVEHQLERIARMKSEETFPVMKEPSESQHQPGAGDRMERAILRRMEYEEKVAPLIQANEDEMNAIEDAIAGLDDPMEREVLRLRYIDGCEEVKSRHQLWKDVAVRLYGDDDEKWMQAAYRLHRRALRNIRKVDDT